MTHAVRYTAARPLDTAPAETRSPGPGEVEPAPAHVGIFGTDLHIFHGDKDARVRTSAALAGIASRLPAAKVLVTALREVPSAGVNGWSSAAWSPETGVVNGPRMPGLHVLYRFGSGDAFAAVLIHGMLTGTSLERALANGTGRAPSSCRPSDRLHRPRRLRRAGSPYRFGHREVAPHLRGCAAHRRS
jgi:sugar/nucleoside kinase (ribokinase family)